MNVSSGRLVFVTGTDTGVGKTYVTAALAAALRERGRKVLALKPIESGIVMPDTPAPAPAHPYPGSDAAILAEASGGGLRGAAAVEAAGGWYRFAPLLSPHLAAREAGVTIDIVSIAAACRAAARGHDVTLVEGAGGVLVPLRDDGATVADLAGALGADVLVVARATLGTINHTLLTLEAARRRGLGVLGVVLNHARRAEADADPSVATNAREIARFAGAPVWGPLETSDASAGAAAGPWLERGARGLIDYLAGQSAAS